MLHLAVLVAVSILLLYVGIKTVSPEKILLAR
jgi:nitrogen fixation-related uncharacterized protein